MASMFLILLTTLLAVNAIPAAKPPAEGFSYLGSFKPKAIVQGRSAANFAVNDYYVSMNAAAWPTADGDCKLIFGPDASLLSVETLEEWNFLKESLEAYSFGATFWTSGMYDAGSKGWKWSTHNVPFTSSTPWDIGEPSATPNPLHRVIFYHGSRYTAFLRAVANTQLHRYVCEVQRLDVAVPCYQTNDLLVVLDSSGSIGENNYELAKHFVDKLVTAFTVHNASRIGFIIYSDVASTIISLTNTLSPASISSVILTTPYIASGTATNLGIFEALSQFISSIRPVPLNMVLLTDGVSYDPNATVIAANTIMAMGVRTYSVGITPSINQAELLAIAGGDSSRVFTTDNFDDLIDLLAPLSIEVCPN